MTQKINVALIGCVFSTEIALKQLASIKNKNFKFSSLVTLKQSRFNSDYIDLFPLAKKENLKVLYAEENSDEEITQEFKALGINLVFVIGWSKLIKEPMLSSFQYGMIGYHPAKLPLNRGRHPIVWALALDLNETASTFFKLGEGADEGPICNQVIVDISTTDRSIDLYNKLMKEIPEQINEIVNGHIENSIIFEYQDEGIATYWRKRTDEDGMIDWRMTSRNIYNLVRSLYTPYPGAYFNYKGERISVLECEETSCKAKNFEPGKIIEVGSNFFVVKTGDTALKVKNTLLKNVEEGAYL